MRIGLDMDGVVVNSVPIWIRLMNENLGTTFAPGDLPSTHSNPEWAAFFDEHAIESTIAAHPVTGAVDALAELRAIGHELVVITARDPKLERLTAAWLEYYGIQVDRMHCLGGASKAIIALAEGIDLLVEDAPYNALAVAEAGVPVLLFGAPYNREVRHPLIHRCEDWDDVLDQIGQRSLRTA